MKTIDTPTSTYELRDDGVIKQTAKGGLRQDIEDARLNIARFLELAGGQRRYLLVDLRECGPTGPGVRQFYAEQAKHLHAVAMIVNSSFSEMIGNFFIRVNQPEAPTRLFRSEATALAWLTSQPKRAAGASSTKKPA